MSKYQKLDIGLRVAALLVTMAGVIVNIIC